MPQEDFENLRLNIEDCTTNSQECEMMSVGLENLVIIRPLGSSDNLLLILIHNEVAESLELCESFRNPSKIARMDTFQDFHWRLANE